MRQKRFQGSHFANDEQATAFNQMVLDGKIDPCLGETYRFDQIGLCHQLMQQGKQPLGVMAAMVSAPRTGMRDV
jgi:crotonyl-CoA carboxylase/reductase